MNGVILGRLGWDEDVQRWGLELKAGWRSNVSESEAVDAEYAETWACNEIADWMSLERKTYAEESPGETKSHLASSS
jgi:hypothetical protein